MPLAEDLADAPVTLVLNPAVARPRSRRCWNRRPACPCTIEEEPTLGEGQVYLRLGADRDQGRSRPATAEIAAAVRGFFDLPRKDATMDDTRRHQPLRPGPDRGHDLGRQGPARWCATCCACRRDAVLPLDRRVDDPVELYVGDRLIARGELQELEASKPASWPCG